MMISLRRLCVPGAGVEPACLAAAAFKAAVSAFPPPGPGVAAARRTNAPRVPATVVGSPPERSHAVLHIRVKAVTSSASATRAHLDHTADGGAGVGYSRWRRFIAVGNLRAVAQHRAA